MVIENRNFHRGNRKITVHLKESEWPKDVPLPKGYSHVIPEDLKPGDVWPILTIRLENDVTRETISGKYLIDGQVDETINWFRKELNAHNWVEVDFIEYSTNHSGITFARNEPKREVHINFQAHHSGKKTFIFVHRIALFPRNVSNNKNSKE